MSCYSCGGNPKTFCSECLSSKDTWIAPVDVLPDPFLGDYDHLYRTPDGNLYALSPDRAEWIRLNGQGRTYKGGDGISIGDDGIINNTKPNRDQTLSIDDRTITITHGNSIELPTDKDTIYNDAELRQRVQTLENRTDNFVTGIKVSKEGNKVKLTYTFRDSPTKEVEFEDKDTVALAYDDTALRERIKALEDRSNSGGVVHRFYNGDIQGTAETDYTTTVKKNSFKNPEGIKVGDTVEDHFTNLEVANRGIWKVVNVNGDDVEVQGLINYNTFFKKNLLFEPNTRVLGIDGGNRVTLPNDIQTLSIKDNTLSISRGNSVTIPQPNLSGYVTVQQYTELKDTFENLLQGLKNSGLWQQTGDSIFKGKFSDDAHATEDNPNTLDGDTDDTSGGV